MHRLHPARLVGLAAVAGLAAAAGVAYASIPDGGGTFHACMLNSTGTIRLIDPSATAPMLRSHCVSGETEVKWNQQGPQGIPGTAGPPGNTDSTVRHFSQFMFDGSTVTVPVVSAKGERGTLSIFCASDPDGSHGGTGHIAFTTDNRNGITEALTFVSPSIPMSSWRQLHNQGSATFAWRGTPNDNVSFEMMIESMIDVTSAPTSPPPTLVDIRGFIQHFDFGGCAFYVYIDASEVGSPMTFTP